MMKLGVPPMPASPASVTSFSICALYLSPARQAWNAARSSFSSSASAVYLSVPSWLALTISRWRISQNFSLFCSPAQRAAFAALMAWGCMGSGAPGHPDRIFPGSVDSRVETARTAPSTTVSATAVANTPRIDVLLYPRLDDRAPSSHERPWRRRARSRGDVPRDGRDLPARHDDRDRHLLVPPPPNNRSGRAVGEPGPPGPGSLSPSRPLARGLTRRALARILGPHAADRPRSPHSRRRGRRGAEPGAPAADRRR